MCLKSRFALVGWVALTWGFAAAVADEPTKTIQADGLSFQAPPNWKQERPRSAMRKLQMKVEPTAGDSAPAEIYLTVLAGGGGGLEQNIARWEGQFAEGGKAPKAKIETKKGKNVTVTRVELAGTFSGMMGMPSQPKPAPQPDTRLLGAIIMAGDTGYFLKLTGPDPTVASISKQFDAMIESIAVDQ